MKKSKRFHGAFTLGLEPVRLLLICWILQAGILVTTAPLPFLGVNDAAHLGTTGKTVIGQGASIGHDIGAGGKGLDTVIDIGEGSKSAKGSDAIKTIQDARGFPGKPSSPALPAPAADADQASDQGILERMKASPSRRPSGSSSPYADKAGYIHMPTPGPNVRRERVSWLDRVYSAAKRSRVTKFLQRASTNVKNGASKLRNRLSGLSAPEAKVKGRISSPEGSSPENSAVQNLPDPSYWRSAPLETIPEEE